MALNYENLNSFLCWERLVTKGRARENYCCYLCEDNGLCPHASSTKILLRLLMHDKVAAHEWKGQIKTSSINCALSLSILASSFSSSMWRVNTAVVSTLCPSLSCLLFLVLYSAVLLCRHTRHENISVFGDIRHQRGSMTTASWVYSIIQQLPEKA